MGKIEYQEKRYQELKARGICISCASAMARQGRVTCQKCADAQKNRNYASLDRDIARQKKTKAKPASGYTLEEISVMAYEKGVSYGTMVAILEGKMKG